MKTKLNQAINLLKENGQVCAVLFRVIYNSTDPKIKQCLAEELKKSGVREGFADRTKDFIEENEIKQVFRHPTLPQMPDSLES